jgi:predicted O-linked N-acetylglucosamine transferase (SPINDLY family)
MKKKPHRPAEPPPANPALTSLLQQAIAHHEAGRLPEAEALYRQILEASPDHPIALHHIGLLAFQVGQSALALQLIDRAIHINPAYAEAHNNRGTVLHSLQQFQEAVAAYDRAIQLNPTYAEAHNNRANSLHSLHLYQQALESSDHAIALNPLYAEAHNNRGNALHQLHRYQEAVAAYDRAIELRPNFADAHNNRGSALHALTLAGVPATAAATGRDLVFYCGPTPEIWNPHTAATTGVGGSEEAVVFLSRLLHRRGWNVTVYASCGQHEQTYDGVLWRPYWLWNYRDKQNVTIIWRHPHRVEHHINSDHILLDLHDVIPEPELPAARLAKIHRIFVKSKFHRSLFPNIPDEKFAIIPNGIDANLFTAAPDRDPLLLINTSSADRSLPAFLDCFEQIKHQVPDARAQWAYGWAGWDVVHSANPITMQWKADMQQRMAQLGVQERGRINAAEIAALYHRAGIFFYPSEMAEIDCISLSKAMAAGAIPITTDFAALGEKSGHGGIFIHSAKTKDTWALPNQFHFEASNPAQQSQFIREAVNLLRNPPAESARTAMRQWARSTFDWNTIADAWHQALAPASPSHSILESYDRAIQLNPHYADAYVNRGNVRLTLKHYPGALQDFDHALQLDPHREYLPGTRLFLKRLLCDWSNAADDLQPADLHQIEAAIQRNEPAALPFATLAFSDSPAIQRRAAEIYVRDKVPPQSAAPIPPRPTPARIRIGYFSADYYSHATTYLMAELFERHDRTRFEIIGFSFSPGQPDPVTSRVSAAMDRFLDVRSMSDAEIAELSRSLSIDIAVDLKGFTRDHRAGIFAHRAAPIQVSYLGYPGTMSAPYIDYLIADPTIIPASSRHHYSEQIVTLPVTYQPNSARPAATTAPTRAAEGLPEDAFVYCCFNNSYKITPAVFDIWMRILTRVPNSVLWLLEENSAAAANLRTEAARRNIAPERLVFAKPQLVADHLARQQLADLFLDTAPYNAHTTASDALWAGLPLLTCPGETFASRVAASLIRAMSLPESAMSELIAPTWPAYQDLAIQLALDPDRYRTLRHHLQQSRLTAPLFDSATFTRHLESAYTAIFHRHQSNQPPTHLQVPT